MGYSGDCCEDAENTKKGNWSSQKYPFLIRLESYFKDGLAKENSSIESNFSKKRILMGRHGCLQHSNIVCLNSRRFKLRRGGGGGMKVDSLFSERQFITKN